MLETPFLGGFLVSAWTQGPLLGESAPALNPLPISGTLLHLTSPGHLFVYAGSVYISGVQWGLSTAAQVLQKPQGPWDPS